MNKDFTVEEGFSISLIFFHDVWPTIENEVLKIPGESPTTHDLFFSQVCLGFESSAEWNEAIFRIIKIPKNGQYFLKISEDDLFSCAIEFCKLHNERYEGRLSYALSLLEEMKENPRKYKKEWDLWKKALDDVMNKYMSVCEFNWDSELPTWN